MNRRQPLSRALDEDGYSSGAGRVRRTGADARMTWRRTAIRSNSTAGQNGPPRYFQRRHATYDLLGSRFSQQHGGDTENEDSEVDESSEPAGSPVNYSFFQLKVVSILPNKREAKLSALSATAQSGRPSMASNFSFESLEDTDEFLAGDDDDGDANRQRDHTDALLNSLIDETYVVGPLGTTIGTDKSCDIHLPKSSGASPGHAKIVWSPVPSKDLPLARSSKESGGSDADASEANQPKAHLSFSDFVGAGRFSLESEVGVVCHVPDSAADEQESGSAEAAEMPIQTATDETVHDSSLFWHMKITIGHVQFRLTPLSPSKLVSTCLFAAVRNNDVKVLMAVMKAAKSPGGLKGTGMACPLLRQTSVQSCKRLNLEIEESQRPDVLVEEEGEAADPDQEQIMSPFHRLPGRSNRSAANRSQYHSIRRATSRRYLRMFQAMSGRNIGLLQVAIEMANPEVVGLLLEEGAEVNRFIESTHVTPLQVAVSRNSVEIVKILLKYGANVEIQNSSGRLPFQYATSHTMRQLLLNTTLLCSATEVGDVQEVKRLLTAGVPANGVGLGGKAALHFACGEGHLEIVRMLLKARADVDMKGGSRLRTPLHYAAMSGVVDIAQCLLDAGAREHTQDMLGYVALNLTDKAEMCRLLNTQESSLCLAAQGGDVQEARRLLENQDLGEEERLDLVNQRNEQHHAAIHLACAAGNIEFIQLLLQHSADVDLPGGGDEWTPLMFAGVAGQASVVEYLLSVGADQSLCSATGDTVQDLVDGGLRKAKDEEQSGQVVSPMIVEVHIKCNEKIALLESDS